MVRFSRVFRFLPAITGLALSLIAIAVVGPERWEFTDSGDYINAVRMLLSSGTYPETGSLPFFRPPLYPLMIAGTWLLAPENYLVIKLVQALMHAATCWLVFRTAAVMFENQFYAGLGALIFAVHPFFLYNAAAIQTETLHTLLMSLALFIFVKGLKAGDLGTARAAVGGAVLGLAALCKPSAIGVGLVLFVAVWFLTGHKVGSLKSLVVGSAAMFLVLLPWTAFNWQTRGEFILVNDAGGFNLWLGNNPATLRLYEGTFRDPQEAQVYADYLGKGLAAEQIAEWERGPGYSGLKLKEREKLWSAKALETIVGDPPTALRLFAWKLFGFWKPYLSTNSYSVKTAVFSAGLQVPLFLLGLFGLYVVGREMHTRKYALLFLILSVTVTVIHVLIVSSMRLRMPYIDPMIAAFAGIGVGIVLTRWKAFARLDGLINKKFGEVSASAA